MILPIVVVDGVGAIALPTPPVAAVYHNNPVPVAVSAVAVVPWQWVTGVVTAGAAGMLLMVTVIAALGPSQAPVDWLT